MSIEATSMAEAVRWIGMALTGALALSVAILAVAAMGFAAFGGVLSYRRAAWVIVGCFILFSAPMTAQALQAMAQTNHPPEVATLPPMPAPRPIFQPPAPVTPSDPYAGAALPNRPIESGDLLPSR